MPTNLEDWAVARGLGEVSFLSNPKKGNAKNVHIPAQLHSSHTLAK